MVKKISNDNMRLFNYRRYYFWGKYVTHAEAVAVAIDVRELGFFATVCRYDDAKYKWAVYYRERKK